VATKYGKCSHCSRVQKVNRHDKVVEHLYRPPGGTMQDCPGSGRPPKI
jgi:hypothetical protein